MIGLSRDMKFLIALAVCTLLAGRAAAVETDIRTVVIFGDTQELVDGLPGDTSTLIPADPDGRANLENLGKMVDWVLANRESQNIDFVLHVGDIIQSGMFLESRLPSTCYQEGVCQSHIEYREGVPCPCRYERQVDLEWERFNSAWRRFDTLVPYAIVRGNHDNIGGRDPGKRRGFRDYFGANSMRGLPGYVESSTFEDIAHVWKFNLGPYPVLVMTLPDGARSDAAQIQWANEVLSRPENRDLPVILLVHRLFNSVPVDYDRPYRTWTQLVAKRFDRIFMTVWGHVSPGNVRMVDVGGKQILDVRSNWQIFRKGPHAATLTLVRFGLGPAGIETVAVGTMTPAGDDRGGPRSPATRMRKQSFPVTLTGSRQ